MSVFYPVLFWGYIHSENKGFGVAIGIFCLLFFIILIGAIIIRYVDVAKKKKRYTLTEGTVLHADWTFEKHPHRWLEVYRKYHFTIRYKTKEGQLFDLPCDDYPIDFIEVKQGDKIKVYYNPANPKDFYAELKNA